MRERGYTKECVKERLYEQSQENEKECVIVRRCKSECDRKGVWVSVYVRALCLSLCLCV